jgi:hypothetical protein
MTIKQDLLGALASLWERYPDWRLGQLVVNAANWAIEPKPEAVWDVEDEQLLLTIKNHMSQKSGS